jgi:hypothetical protein
MSFDAGTDVTVVGTGFLSAGNHANVADLLSTADVTVRLSEQDLGAVVAAGDSALDSLVSQLHAAGMDTLALDAGQVDQLAGHAGMSFDAGTIVELSDALSLSLPGFNTAELKALFADVSADVKAMLSLSDLQQISPLDKDELASAIDVLQTTLDDAGVHKIEISDDLANALADADVQFQAAAGTTTPIAETVIVKAQADGLDGIAYLKASLEDMRTLGVDEVRAGPGVITIDVALHDADSSVFSLTDLPNFYGESATSVNLVINEADLAALLDLDESGAFSTLGAAGITGLQYTGSDESYQEFIGISGHMAIQQATLNAVEVELLGLGTPTADPMDPFHKPS